MKLKSLTYIIAAIIIGVLGQSCKSKKIVGEGTVNESLTVRKVVKNHETNALDVKTVRGKLAIDFDNGDNSQSFSVNYRMEKDKAIWLSAAFGVVKAYITPQNVSFYNKLDNTYFNGDYSYISNVLGTPINFDQLQNVLLGQAITPLQPNNLSLVIQDNKYVLKPEQQQALYKQLFFIEPMYFKIASQQIAQPEAQRLLTINYSDYQMVDGQAFPDKIIATAQEKNNTTTITLEYKNIEFNAPVSFPFEIPSGYSPIELE